MIIGLTGGIASGKSTVSRILAELGAAIIDADQLAREIMEPYTPAWWEVKEAFGEEVFLPSDELDRERLAEIIFNDQAARKKLDEITHPWVRIKIKQRIEDLQSSGEEIIVAEVPLLIEAEMVDLFTEVWVVYVKREVQINRLREREGISRQAAIARIDSQLSLEEKVDYAQRVIVNEGSKEELRQQLLSIWKEINND
ncbi:dephospho-CoA kinase [Fuchsiella alkaliacetigena]|uniref:dephospho-CoA kinase n=1 Tax=Fuchsiella alkaliacetigena TaxID=957042 RepID=UPI00200A37F5|nr:dephospho-CoA kinase [Fuchsiella alkaliacetigena]MCK8824016.1 dephospho-CoA kinase [Fuchsiella alkaliacetigena]